LADGSLNGRMLYPKTSLTRRSARRVPARSSRRVSFTVVESARGFVSRKAVIIALSHTKGGKKMSTKQNFTTEEAHEIGDKLGIDWSRFDVEQFPHGFGC